jgi:hypothetical protein
MRLLGLFAAAIVASCATSAPQKPAPQTAPPQGSELDAAMVGVWTGTLEYRDYQSDGRVTLPTWLTIKREGSGLQFDYVYDDGPTKVVRESTRVTIDLAAKSYRVVSDPAKAPDLYAIAGIELLKQGRGTLTLSGSGIDNDAPAEIRTTLRVGRNLLKIDRETRLPGEEFKFRHGYTFVRATPPAL